MAANARQDFAALRDEHMSRVGRLGDTVYSPRAERFIEAAYLDLALQFHHYELDKVDTTVQVAIADVSKALPTDTFIVGGIDLRNATTEDFLHKLEYMPARALFRARREGTNRRPKNYARFATTVYFDLPSDAAYHTTIYYYRRPALPDFDTPTTVSELDRIWDDHIIEASVAKALGALWRWEEAAATLQRLDTWMQRSVNPALVSVRQHDQPEAWARSDPHGGAQG